MQHEENLIEVERLQGEKTTLEKEIAELQSGRRPLHGPHQAYQTGTPKPKRLWLHYPQPVRKINTHTDQREEYVCRIGGMGG